MPVAVFDTYVPRPDGRRMHFDILVRNEPNERSGVLGYGRRYLADKGILSEALVARDCQFCRGGRADRLHRRRQHRCGPGRTPHSPGPIGVRGLCVVIRQSAFFLYEPHRVRSQQAGAGNLSRS